MRQIREVTKERYTVHRPVVECTVCSFVEEGQAYVQLDSYGSEGRERPGQASQSLQLDEQAVRQLLAVIERAFPNIR